MEVLRITGGHRLSGQVKASGAKNSALKLMVASLLCPGDHSLTNVPHLTDVYALMELLETLGAKVTLNDHVCRISVPENLNTLADYKFVSRMRASILVLGPLLARMNKAQVALPGGCAIGTRPIDLHLKAIKALGAKIELDHGYVKAQAPEGLTGTHIIFDQVSVGATENAMMAAVLAKGTTILQNAAREPEIVDLANFLNQLGAKIFGAGTDVIEIQGVKQLRPMEPSFRVMDDRIEIGTLLIAGAITGGDVTVHYEGHHHVDVLLEKLQAAGCEVFVQNQTVRVRAQDALKSVDVVTAPYPQFATDLQAQFMALMCVAHGTSVITETIFENRFMHVPELIRLGADISVHQRSAIIKGKPKGLRGTVVKATDLRASAGLVIAGLVASGVTIVHQIQHLDRGYESLEMKLNQIGAHVERLEMDLALDVE